MFGDEEREIALHLKVTETVSVAYRAAASSQYMKSPTFVAWWLRETLPELHKRFPAAAEALKLAAFKASVTGKSTNGMDLNLEGRDGKPLFKG